MSWYPPLLDPHTAIAIRAAFHEGTSPWQSERITAWVTATIAGAPTDAFQRLLDDLEAHPKPLSPRETQVVRLASQGLTATQTARVLGIAATTVKTHRLRARRKLGICSFADAVALWLMRED